VKSEERIRIADQLLAIAREAAEIIRRIYRTRFEVRYKGPSDPVTAADSRANALIVARLSEAFPDVPVVAEESDPESFLAYRESERIFFVDPLDGTREFVNRNDEFAVMIGLVEAEQATVGVIHAPATDVGWAGAVGAGAWRLDPAGRRETLKVSDVSEMGEARMLVSRSHTTRVLKRAVRVLGAGAIDQLGSAGLKCAAVASGKAEAYVAPGRAGKRWDVCAGDALIAAAGGRVSDGKGRPFDYRAPSLTNAEGIIASNGKIHDLIVERLAAAEARAKRSRGPAGS
jgi:3'(2'), 5'-bisphosphate nucleotidase